MRNIARIKTALDKLSFMPGISGASTAAATPDCAFPIASFEGRLRRNDRSGLVRHCLDKKWASLSASICAALLLAACGVGSDLGPDVPDAPAAGASEQAQPAAVNPAPVYDQRVYAAPPSSSDMFRDGFNPSLWNDRNWYDCNCGRHPDTSPSSTPWGFSAH